jgi:hypothetical protein
MMRMRVVLSNNLRYLIPAHPAADAETLENLLSSGAFARVCVSELTQKIAIQGKIAKTLTQ